MSQQRHIVSGDAQLKKLSLLRLLGAATASGAAAYGAYVAAAWLRYGRPRRASAEEADSLLDRFMPEYDVVERRSIQINAPAEVALRAACRLDLEGSCLVRAIFKGRELLLGARSDAKPLPRGLLAKTKALGWCPLAEVLDREIVMGAATEPWAANPVFRPLAPEDFAAFRDPRQDRVDTPGRSRQYDQVHFPHRDSRFRLRSSCESQIQEILGFPLTRNHIDPSGNAPFVET
jgi:hypothetical protein